MKKKTIITLMSIGLLLSFNETFAQQGQDTARVPLQDSSLLNITDTTATANDTSLVTSQPKIKSYNSIINDLLFTNKLINVKDAPVFFIAEKKQVAGKEFIFYSLCILVLILGIFKTFFKGYYNNLFRVFFNTSLRQTQLTDQLLQAKLPSFILNIFFAFTAGTFIWLLFVNSHSPGFISQKLLLPFCILGIGTLYFVKYLILKFIGWLSTMQETINSYIFIIFLVNKISGIVLVPFIIILAFPLSNWVYFVTIISLLVVFLFFLSRYFKTYSVLDRKFPLHPFHFLIYVFATEIIPLLILYKVTVDYLL